MELLELEKRDAERRAKQQMDELVANVADIISQMVGGKMDEESAVKSINALGVSVQYLESSKLRDQLGDSAYKEALEWNGSTGLVLDSKQRLQQLVAASFGHQLPPPGTPSKALPAPGAAAGASTSSVNAALPSAPAAAPKQFILPLKLAWVAKQVAGAQQQQQLTAGGEASADAAGRKDQQGPSDQNSGSSKDNGKKSKQPAALKGSGRGGRQQEKQQQQAAAGLLVQDKKGNRTSARQLMLDSDVAPGSAGRGGGMFGGMMAAGMMDAADDDLMSMSRDIVASSR